MLGSTAMELHLQLQEALLGERLSPEDQRSLKKYGVIWRTASSGHKVGIDPKTGKAKKGNPHVISKRERAMRKAKKGVQAVKAGAEAAKDVAGAARHGAKAAAAEHGHDSFFKKLAGKAKTVAKALLKAPKEVKAIYTDPEHRKKVFSKENMLKGAKSVSEYAGRAAAKTWGHIKHEGHNARVAGKALWRIRNTDVKDIRETWKSLPEKERAAIKGTVKAAVMTIGGTAAGGHFGVGAIAQHFLGESLMIGAITADELRDGQVLTEDEQQQAGEKILRDAIEATVKKMLALQNASEEEMVALAAKLNESKELEL